MSESTLNALKSPLAAAAAAPGPSPAEPAHGELVDAVAQSRSALVRQARRMLQFDDPQVSTLE